jgi:hypothetical protein
MQNGAKIFENNLTNQNICTIIEKANNLFIGWKIILSRSIVWQKADMVQVAEEEKAVKDLPRQNPVVTSLVQQATPQVIGGEICHPKVKISRFTWQGSFALPCKCINIR